MNKGSAPALPEGDHELDCESGVSKDNLVPMKNILAPDTLTPSAVVPGKSIWHNQIKTGLCDLSPYAASAQLEEAIDYRTNSEFMPSVKQ